jgi:hypothetical protein
MKTLLLSLFIFICPLTQATNCATKVQNLAIEISLNKLEDKNTAFVRNEDSVLKAVIKAKESKKIKKMAQELCQISNLIIQNEFFE